MNNKFILPELAYQYDALDPYVSESVMRLHHDKHHRTYVDKLNEAVEGLSLSENSSLETLLGNLDNIPTDTRTAVRNNGGGHYNHSLFWQCMSPQGGGQPSGELAGLIDQKYGSYQNFVDEFSKQALGVFGSGWAWLMPDMEILTTPNQDNPLMSGSSEPLLGLDVWEHAYYLDYKNVRADYVKAWWNVVNWDFISQRYGG